MASHVGQRRGIAVASTSEPGDGQCPTINIGSRQQPTRHSYFTLPYHVSTVYRQHNTIAQSLLVDLYRSINTCLLIPNLT